MGGRTNGCCFEIRNEMKNPPLQASYFKDLQFKHLALILFLPLVWFSAKVEADGPSSKLINYNGRIGQNESHYDVRVELRINNENPHPKQDCHVLPSEWNCTYHSYGIGVRIYNNHSHAIRLDLKESLIFSQFPPTTCEAQISWVDERGPQKQYRVAPSGFIIDPYTYLGIGAIASRLGSSPACLYEDRNWEVEGYNVNLYWKEIIPPPPKQPPTQQPPTQQPPTSQPPVQPTPVQPPPSQPSPVPDPAAKQKHMDADRFAQRIDEITKRMYESDFGDAAMCRFHTDSLAAHRDMANQLEDASLAEVMRPLIASLEQTQVEACDRSTWSDASLQTDSPAGSQGCSGNDKGSAVCLEFPESIIESDLYERKVAPGSSGNTKTRPPAKAELDPCMKKGIAGTCID